MSGNSKEKVIFLRV